MEVVVTQELQKHMSSKSTESIASLSELQTIDDLSGNPEA